MIISWRVTAIFAVIIAATVMVILINVDSVVSVSVTAVLLVDENNIDIGDVDADADVDVDGVEVVVLVVAGEDDDQDVIIDADTDTDTDKYGQKKNNNNKNRKKTKTNNNNNNNNNELLWSLFWGRGRGRAGRLQHQKIKKEQQQQQAYIDDGDSNSDEYFTTNTYFNDEDFYKKRIKETLKKFYKLNDFQTRFAIKASTVSSVIIAVDTAVVSMESTITTVDDDDDDNTDIDDDVLLQGTVLEVFRTPPHQPREAKEYDDDDDDDQDDQDDQDEDHEDEDHVYDNLPSDYYHFLKSQGGDGSDGHNECDSRYMLCEPIHLELGNAPKHYMDFAYTSAVVNSNKPAHSSSSSSLEVESTTDAALSLLFDKHDYNVDEKEDQTTTCKDIVSTATTTTTTNDADHHTSTTTTTTEKDDDNDKTMSFFSAWWNWWLPFTNSDWWKANGSTQSDYDLGTTGAFAGGSNGEVWKGHRVCRPSPSLSSSSSKKSHEDGCDDQTQLVLKRLRVERGYLLLEAGLREVYFGKLIQTQLNNDEHNMYTVYVDHFFREVPKKRPRINKKSLFGVAGLPANNKHYQQQQQGGNDLELWIVYEDAGPSLRSYIYTPTVTDGGFIMYQHSKLWTQLRTFTNIEQARANKKDTSSSSSIQVQMQTTLDDHDNDGIDEVPPPPLFASSANKKKRSNTNNKKKKHNNNNNNNRIIHIGRLFMQNTLREILSAAAELHKRGIVHRDIKPSNVMCKSDRPLDDIDDYIHSFDSNSPLPKMHCRLGDFSSGWDLYTNEHLYTKGPTSGEQTNEYAPPESFVGPYWVPFHTDKPQSYDSWSVGVLALELLLGTPNVFSVDQRTNAILTYKMKRSNASENEISNALYLAALSNFCIYIPSNDTSNKPQSWPLRHGDPLHKTSMVKESCTLQDFHRALRARDPLGIGFDSSTDLLLHLIWQLLAFDPNERMTAEEALQHPYFISPDGTLDSLNEIPGFHNALESQMLDPRIDFNVVDDINEFVCPKCGRVFHDWESCHRHANLRKHSKFCTYNHTYLPSCINTHTMLPEHPTSGYCDLQGRRPTIEDFHSIHLHHDHQFYGMFDGHTGNLASKFAASQLYGELMSRLPNLENILITSKSDNVGGSVDEQYSWKEDIRLNVTQAFENVHDQFLERISTMTSPNVEVGTAPNMDQSGTTATAILVTDKLIIAATLGDSRAVISSSWARTTKSDNNSDSSRSSSSHSNKNSWKGFPSVSAVQFSIDHVASHPTERDLVIERGGYVSASGGIPRVNGILAVTRSIGDADLSPVLSREPHILVLDRSEIQDLCGSLGKSSNDNEEKQNGHTIPCFVILASDGLWDVMSNQEAIDMVVDIILREQNIELYDDNIDDAKEITTIPSSSDSNNSNNNKHHDIDNGVYYYNDDHEAADAAGGPFQEAAERLAVEAYVRGSTDNIGVCVVAI